MSYRAFKHLLGETSLERKCLFLFGAGILLLITASFWLYARITEHLAYEQTTTPGRLLVNSYITKQHLNRLHIQEGEWRPEERGSDEKPEHLSAQKWTQLRRALDELSQEDVPAPVKGYRYQVIKPNAQNRL